MWNRKYANLQVLAQLIDNPHNHVQEQSDSDDKHPLQKISFMLLNLQNRSSECKDQSNKPEQHDKLEGIVFHLGDAIKNQTNLQKKQSTKLIARCYPPPPKKKKKRKHTRR